MRVRGVLTRQGRDISDLLNEVAGDQADSYTGVLIDPLWSALAYNVGNSRLTDQLIQLVADSPEHERRLEYYRKALKKAEVYRITMAATVGEGIAAKMAEAEDEPITNEWTEPHANGSIVAKAWGTKGLYVASPDSGGWLAAGPFGVEG